MLSHLTPTTGIVVEHLSMLLVSHFIVILIRDTLQDAMIYALRKNEQLIDGKVKTTYIAPDDTNI
jgi:hypothetical protein